MDTSGHRLRRAPVQGYTPTIDSTATYQLWGAPTTSPAARAVKGSSIAASLPLGLNPASLRASLIHLSDRGQRMVAVASSGMAHSKD